MKRNSALAATALCAVAAIAALAIGLETTASAAKTKTKAATANAQVERGKLLVTVGGCNDCHTPMVFDKEIGGPVPDMSHMLSGHPAGAPDPESTLSGHDQAVIGPTFTSFKLPFGTVYTANLTSDKDTGIGSWTPEMFRKAMHTGRHLGGVGRPILPPMPWQGIGQLSDQDLDAILAYLKTVPAVKNAVPDPKVPPEALKQIQAQYDKMAARMKNSKPM